MTIWAPSIRSLRGPRYKAIADQLAHDVRQGRLLPGQRLPTHRDLADELGVTVGTVSRAYAEAERRGLIRGELGRGTFVAGPGARWDPLLSPQLKEDARIDLSLNLPLHALDPDLGGALRALSERAELNDLLRYQPFVGTRGARDVGVRWLSWHGLDVEPEQAVVTAGAQHAITVLLSTLCRPGDAVIADAITYPGVKNVASLLGLRLVGVRGEKGAMDLDHLGHLCDETGAKVLYCMTTLNNPTSHTASAQARAELAQLARRRDLRIIEDDVHRLLEVDAPPPLAALAPERCFYVTSTSKVLAGGLRVGFVAAPRGFVDRLAFAVAASMYVLPPLNVELATMWIKDGTAQAVAESKRDEARARQKLAGTILSGRPFLSAPTSYFLWLMVEPGWAAGAFCAAAREQGVLVSPASAFAVRASDAPAAVRVSLSGPDSRAEMEKGVRVLADLLDQGPALAPAIV